MLPLRLALFDDVSTGVYGAGGGQVRSESGVRPSDLLPQPSDLFFPKKTYKISLKYYSFYFSRKNSILLFQGKILYEQGAEDKKREINQSMQA